MKKHLKYIDGSSDKFWQIEVLNNTYTVTYGRNGTSGTSQTKTFDDDEQCLKAAEKLLNEKTKKGYSETGEVVASQTASTPKKDGDKDVAEILSAYDAILKEKNLAALLPFLQENAKGNIELLKRHIKGKKRYWMAFVDLTNEPQFKTGNYSWGTRGDEKLKELITLTAIAILGKTDIMSWDEAFDLLAKAKQRNSILAVLQWAKPDWINEFILDKVKKSEWRSFSYQTLRFLESEALTTVQPELYALCLANANEWVTKVKPRDFIQYIVNDELAYTRDVPNLYQYETGIQNNHFRDNDNQAYNEFSIWEIIYNTLLQEGKLDRQQFIEQCILTQTKAWNNNLKSFYRKRLTDLNPGAAELIIYQEYIFACLQYAFAPVVNAAVEWVKQIYEEKKFNINSFLDWLEPLMMSNDNKTAIKNILPVLEKLNKSQPKLNKKITALIADVYVVPDLNLQERASKLLLKIASPKDTALRDKLSGYTTLMLGNVRSGLSSLLTAEDLLPTADVLETYHFKPKQEKVLNEAIVPPKDWNDVVYLFGKFIASEEIADGEILINTYITQRYLFPADYAKQLAPYGQQVEKKYFESIHKNYIGTFLREKIKSIDYVFTITQNTYHKIKTLLLIRPYLDIVQKRMASNISLPMLSFPTHYPHWVAPKVLLERLIAYQESEEEINALDLSIAIGRMPREQVEEALPLLDQLNGEIKQLMAFCLGTTKDIVFKTDNIFNKLFTKIGGSTDPGLKSVWAMAARTYYPDESFPVFNDTYLKDYPMAVAPFKPVIRIKEKWNEYMNYQTKKMERSPSWYALEFDSPAYVNNHGYFLFSLDLFGRKNSWEYMMSGEGNVYYWNSLMPQNSDALSWYILRSSCQHSSGGVSELKGFLHVINSTGFHFSDVSILVFACTFFMDKKEVRLMASEVLINLIEKQIIDLDLLATKLAYLASNKYGAFLRLVESIGTLKDVSALHNSAFLQLLESLLKHLVITDKLPVNFKKLVEHYIDMLYKTNQQPSAAAIAFFEGWKDNAALKSLIKQITTA
jgi:predicted DNA-binding WGR domain protein